MALTAERVERLLGLMGQVQRYPDAKPYAERELTALRLEMDRRYLFPARRSRSVARLPGVPPTV